MVLPRHLPWYGLSQNVSEASSALEAMEMSGNNWDVIPHQVYWKDRGVERSVPNRVGLVRQDTGEVLSIVSEDSYHILQNRECFNSFDALFESGELRFDRAGYVNGGRKVFLSTKFTTDWTVGDDPVNLYLLLSNDHTGIGSAKVAVTPIRMACQNMLTFAIGKAKKAWSIWHTSTMEARIREARTAVELANNYMNEFVEMGNRMVDRKLSANLVERFVEILFRPSSDSDRARQYNQERIQIFESCMNAPDLTAYKGTAWQLINAVSDYETHKKQSNEILMRRVLEDNLPMFKRTFTLLNSPEEAVMQAVTMGA